MRVPTQAVLGSNTTPERDVVDSIEQDVKESPIKRVGKKSKAKPSGKEKTRRKK